MQTESEKATAALEKNSAALTSVIAAVGLTTFKIVVGLMTNSLGILAEAAHSGLDLVAALVTLFAVRASGTPADSRHPYGHGKIENLSALFETLLLLVTCVWIIYESIQRLFYKSVEVDPSIWAFIVMAVSIAIDYSRSRVLYHAARKHNSQALEADALHFSTDIWSSSVVILGLVGVWASTSFSGLSWLSKADAIAALGVACIVVYVSLQMGLRTIQGLMDSAPQGLADQIQAAVTNVPGVLDLHKLRIRGSGPGLFVDAHIRVSPTMTVKEAHTVIEQVEQAINTVAPNADITIHPDPMEEVPG